MFESAYNPLGVAARRLPKNPVTRGGIMGDLTPTLGNQRSMSVFRPGGQAAIMPAPSAGPTMMQFGVAAAIGIGGGYALAYFMKPKRSGKKRRKSKK